jgi:hypothetical protein
MLMLDHTNGAKSCLPNPPFPTLFVGRYSNESHSQTPKTNEKLRISSKHTKVASNHMEMPKIRTDPDHAMQVGTKDQGKQGNHAQK